jgi:hypothetical protein
MDSIHMKIAHSKAERGNDLYETPECAVTALLRAENISGPIWEPACGRGAIAGVFNIRGFTVVASDLNDYGYGSHGVDFLTAPAPGHGAGWIITNPPYLLAAEFVRRAIELGVPNIAMLLRLNFLESVRRADILDGGHLARVHVFANRLPMMHRDGWTGNRVSSAVAHAWFVWDMTRKGPTVVDRILWTSEGEGGR